MYCSRCGVDNRANASFCEKCGLTLSPAAPPPAQPYYQPPPPPAYPPSAYIAPPVIPADPRMRGVAMEALDSAGRSYAVGKNPAVSFLLSFFLPAFGQVYNGDLKKCFAMWGGYLLSFIFAVFTGGVGSILGFGVWIWSMIDAYNVASRKSPLW